MTSFAQRPSIALFFSRLRALPRARQWLCGAVAALVLTGGGMAEEPKSADFGKDIQLAPFVVKGKSLAVSIRARTKSDRRYGEKFSDEVVQIAYETMNDTTGKGLVIVGEDKEPHPIILFRRFIAMDKAGQLDPGLAAAAAELAANLKKLEEKMHFDDGPKETGITFETFLPALPMPLKGTASKLYQLAWAEGFNEAKVEKMLKSLTPAGLARDDLSRYDWVFYLPPHSTTSVVLKEVLDKGMKAEKMGFFKRAAIKSAVVVFRPVVNKAVEGLRKGLMFRSILEASGKWNAGDVDALSRAYMEELMPDLKPGNGDEHARALAAIEKQKIANAEYAKDPYVKPERLATFDAAAYEAFEGEYGSNPEKPGPRFTREGEVFHWNRATEKPRIFYPAGERLLVNESGSMTIQFLIDDKGTVTGVEERRVRNRRTIPRKVEVAAPVVAAAK
jgi:hypothetical protein